MSGAWDRDEAGAFVETLFAKHHGEIYAYLLRMMRDPEVAADMTQDAFIKAYKNYETLEKPENARAWLYQIAHRVALDEIRRRKIIRFFPWTGESRGAAPSAEHLVMDARLSGDMQRALERIPERQRAALLLAELHDLTGLELAAALGVSHVAARALLTRARESLRQALAAERAADAAAEAADGAATMSRFGRVARRPDQWSSPHERARTRAAERIDVAAGSGRGRLARRASRRVRRAAPRSPPPTTPTASSCGRCATSRSSRRATSGRGRRPASSARPRVVAGTPPRRATAADRSLAVPDRGAVGDRRRGHRRRRDGAVRWLARPADRRPHRLAGGRRRDPGRRGRRPCRRPPRRWPSRAGSVGWVHSTDDGAFAYNTSPRRPRLPAGGPARLRGPRRQRRRSASRWRPTPRSIIGSPTDDQAVVVGSDGSGADQVFLLSLPAEPRRRPTDAECHAGRARPRRPRRPRRAPRRRRPRRRRASRAARPRSPRHRRATTPSTEPRDRDPGTHPGRRPPEPTPAATPEPTPIPTASPQATATAIAIATGVKVVGQSAAFSADGTWFAFTAEPADGSAGPDIYVWHMGDETADRLTTDGSSVFASWAGDTVVGSRLVVDDTGADGVPAAVSFIADPKTGKETGDPIALWRPVVDPTGRFAVAWSGTVTTGDDGTRLDPGCGRAGHHELAAGRRHVRDAARRSRASTARSPTSTSAGTSPASGSRSGPPSRPTRPSAGSRSSASIARAAS